MTPRRIFRRLSHMSAADFYKWISEPQLQWAKAAMPNAVSSLKGITTLFPHIERTRIEKYLREFLENHKFFEELNSRMITTRHRRVRPPYWAEFIYLATRILEPAVVVETGVFDGESSAVLLLALADTGSGTLISVDLPQVGPLDRFDELLEMSLPQGCQPGWVVPQSLQSRWQLMLGDSRKMLPTVFETNPIIDIFFHDSLHTFQHQYFEYSLAWPHLRQGGLLMSDDIMWSHAFHKFCREQHRSYINLYRGSFQGGTVEGFGATLK
jgi:predicted O-methyltransferase YrrM